MRGDQGSQGRLAQHRLLGLLLYHDAEHRHERPSRMRRTRWPPPRRRCLGCLAPLENGHIVCSEECDELAWRITPTIGGDLWEPSQKG
jgi:hypothetical protein